MELGSTGTNLVNYNRKGGPGTSCWPQLFHLLSSVLPYLSAPTPWRCPCLDITNNYNGSCAVSMSPSPTTASSLCSSPFLLFQLQPSLGHTRTFKPLYLAPFYCPSPLPCLLLSLPNWDLWAIIVLPPPYAFSWLSPLSFHYTKLAKPYTYFKPALPLTTCLQLSS